MTIRISLSMLRAAAIEAGARFGTLTCNDAQQILWTRYRKNVLPEYVWRLLSANPEICKNAGIVIGGVGSGRRRRTSTSIKQHVKVNASFPTPVLDWLGEQVVNRQQRGALSRDSS